MTVGRRGDTNCDGDVRVAVMGDSYISGEGAYDYLPRTDVHDEPCKNLCHRSPNTWPVRLSRWSRRRAQLIDPEDYAARSRSRRATPWPSWPAAARRR